MIRINILSDKIQDCRTVKEVEILGCHACADKSGGHWGWCDVPWIICPYKTKIKEILSKPESKFIALEDQINFLEMNI